MLMEGLLHTFPEIQDAVDVEYVDFARPRTGLVELVGEANQFAPTLVLSGDAPENLATGEFRDNRFVQGGAALMSALHELCGIPHNHP